MSADNIKIWDLKEITEELTERIPEIEEIYLFGSRAYNTNSLRSDIDLLAFTNNKPIKEAQINDWLPVEYPPVDLFHSYDKKTARSIANGSSICLRENDKASYQDLPEQLDAIKLWDKTNGFYSDVEYEQKSLIDIRFPMSIIPGKSTCNLTETIETAIKRIKENGIDTFFAGSSIFEISETILNLIETGMTKPHKFQKKANSFSFDTIKLCDEYDFQNYIHSLLRPIFNDIEPEPVTVTIDGNDKKADFALNNNRIIIEAKWIDSEGKKSNVIKTLDGLGNFYKENSRVESIIFVILYSSQMKLDEIVLNARYEKKYADPPVFVRFIKNTYE